MSHMSLETRDNTLNIECQVTLELNVNIILQATFIARIIVQS